MNKYRILIVEDDSGIADGVARPLTSWGMEAGKVQDFRNVSTEFTAHNPYLVLMRFVVWADIVAYLGF